MKGNASHSSNARGKKGLKSKPKKKRKDGQECNSFAETENLDLMKLLEKHECHLKPRESESRNSRLSPTLTDIMKDPVALGYFMEFLDCREMRHFLDFYLAVAAFRTATQQRAKVTQRKVSSSKRPSFVENGPLNIPNGIHVDNGSSAKNERVFLTLSEKSFPGKEFPLNDTSCDQETHNYSNTNRNFAGSEPQTELNLHSISSINGRSINSIGKFPLSDFWEPFSADETNGRTVAKEPSRESQDVLNESSYRHHARSRTGTTIVDAVTVYTRYISLDADFPIGVSSKIRQRIEAEICKDKEKVDPACFEEAYQHAKERLEEMQKEFINSRSGNIYQWHIVQGNKLKLEDILYNDASLFYFMEFLDQNGFRVILEFWLMAENFQQTMSHKLEIGSFNINEAIEDAMALYNKYFSMQSAERLITDDKIRIVLENNICREDGPQSSCFAIPVAYAWTALKEILFPRFQQSDTYRKYLQGLLKSSTRELKTDDNASVSSGSMSGSSNVLSSTGENDMDFLDRNPDSLWYRPAAGRLALGHMDEFGNFVTESEPEPDQDVSRLSKAMKNILKKKGSSKDKEKEKMALERARQIIEDIQKCNQ